LKDSCEISPGDAAPVRKISAARGVALLTPYDGGNLGDAAIQDALIYNLRKAHPPVPLCGITLYPEKTSAVHHLPCYPLAALTIPFYNASRKAKSSSPDVLGSARPKTVRWRRVPVSAAFSIFRSPWKALQRIGHEIRHACQSYALLRHIDLLLIAGGGQLDEEWGGPWGHPFALFKWTVLARLAGSSVAFLSVGACLTESRWTRFFLKTALSTAHYRSYRDKGSREIALSIHPKADGPIVPDLAFSLPAANFSRQTSSNVRVGVSPIAYGHPSLWPTRDPEKYRQYMRELGTFISALLRNGMHVSLFSSANPDDEIFAELTGSLDATLGEAELEALTIIKVASLYDLLALLQSVDFVVASRLHGLILSFFCGKPSLAISYDRKVQTLMNDLNQADYCVDIRSVQSADLLAKFAKMQANRDGITMQLEATLGQYRYSLETQYEMIQQIISSESRKSEQQPSSLSTQGHQS
jgi:polysaccharide pyruvyl transferase WcaK-like protein